MTNASRMSGEPSHVEAAKNCVDSRASYGAQAIIYGVSDAESPLGRQEDRRIGEGPF